jgi:hypothetical protein
MRSEWPLFRFMILLLLFLITYSFFVDEKPFYCFTLYNYFSHFRFSFIFASTAKRTFSSFLFLFFRIYSNSREFNVIWLRLCNDEISNWTLKFSLPSIELNLSSRIFPIWLDWKMNVNWLCKQGVFEQDAVVSVLIFL